jgi:hypothetical protein
LLPESAFSERKLVHLDVDIVVPAGQPQPNLYLVAQLLTTVTRKCPRVEVTLRLARSEFRNPALTAIAFPRVYRAVVSGWSNIHYHQRDDYWSFFLGGRVFPDLRQLETNGFKRDVEGTLPTIGQQFNYPPLVDEEYDHTRAAGTAIEVQRLEHLQNLKIEGDIMLNEPLLLSLFGTTSVPACLTTLEIVNCPKLILNNNLPALSTLLQRALTTLPVLRKLKLHVLDDYLSETDYHDLAARDPQHHLCNIVRVHGQSIEHLDLSLPYTCNHIFPRPYPRSRNFHSARPKLGPPTISREPPETLPQRIISQGFKYRRLIYWRDICVEQHGFEAMASCAGAQGAEYSWEVVTDLEVKGVWHAGDHDAVRFDSDFVIGFPQR